ncbi:4-(cytidine 5'-diphospho)-2-C-methyl-D-erythritol kinase [Opitutales bacterium ASA1]|uniref:4-(cytidine 5'-diphospho)-2-C-methyl-D-erythritol kinase n=1 Tax=Congregicoccus parvus TaxID=3081749 RepID=UPI002B30B235|nr:4-(cytidine 5'-diphospho)-2-C-methyl-D-erythritol kinase [Opitutales bacterium ASA1]
MSSLTLSSPAKINLFLAVTGRRPDGFHDLVSLVAPVQVGDTIRVTVCDRTGGTDLRCSDPSLPSGADNLAYRAVDAFRAATGFDRAVEVELEKQLPSGAGLGGGSSNASTVLRGLNTLAGDVLDEGALRDVAAGIGSDCPLFLAGGPCIVRGRGERLEVLSEAVAARLRGVRVLLFKPDFGIGTPWAYSRLAADPGRCYLAAQEAEARLAAWIAGGVRLSELLFNSFESVIFAKFVALPVLVEILQKQAGVEGVLLSGSGSACFAILDERVDAERLVAIVRETLGRSAWDAVSVIA